MIVLRDFRLEETGDRVEAICDIVSDRLPDQLRFGTDRDRAHYLDINQPNWAAVALFYPAMMFGEDLAIEADLSPRLLYNLRNDLMSLFRSYEPSLKSITVQAGMATSDTTAYPDSRGVATAFSGGVDSFCTTMIYDNPDVPESLRLDTLMLFNVGAFGRTGSDKATALMERGRASVEEYADRKGYSTVFVDSNMDDIFRPVADVGPADFVKTVGLRNSSAALLLQKGLKTYLPSSSVYWDAINCVDGYYTGSFEPISLPMLSTEHLHLQSAGAGLTRNDKQMLIASDPDVQTRLNVCVQHDRLDRDSAFVNCGRCWKCLHTKTIFEAAGVLDRFGAVFDLEYHRANHAALMQDMADLPVTRGIGHETIKEARAAGIHIPRPRSRLRRYLIALGPKLVKRRKTVRRHLRTVSGQLRSLRRRLIRGRKKLFRNLGLR